MNTHSIQQARYVSLVTFRKSGTEVATPVWAAYENGAYYIFSAGSAGKVKRLRNSDQAKLAKCDLRGNLLGEWHEARAWILEDDEQIALALKALRDKYGFTMWITDLGAKLTGRFKKRAYLGVVLAEDG